MFNGHSVLIFQDGHTALAFAKAHDHYDVEEILLAYPGIVTSISSKVRNVKLLHFLILSRGFSE